jgi:hypothetical protein
VEHPTVLDRWLKRLGRPQTPALLKVLDERLWIFRRHGIGGIGGIDNQACIGRLCRIQMQRLVTRECTSPVSSNPLEDAKRQKDRTGAHIDRHHLIERNDRLIARPADVQPIAVDGVGQRQRGDEAVGEPCRRQQADDQQQQQAKSANIDLPLIRSAGETTNQPDNSQSDAAKGEDQQTERNPSPLSGLWFPTSHGCL